MSVVHTLLSLDVHDIAELVEIRGTRVAEVEAARYRRTGLPTPVTGSFDLSYPGAKNFYEIGDIVNVQLMVGSLTVAPAPATLNISRFELDLNCDNNPSDSSVPCVNTQGALISYVGNLTWNCPAAPAVTFTATPGVNSVVFTPSETLNVPTLVPDYCTLNFQVQVLGFGAGVTIQENAGFGPGGASCNTNPVLPANNSVSGQLKVCNCDDGSVCTTDRCDPRPGCQHTPIVCNDNNVCTTDTCDRILGCQYTPGRSGLQRQQRVHDGHVRSDPGLPERCRAPWTATTTTCARRTRAIRLLGCQHAPGRSGLQRQQRVHDGHVRSDPGLPEHAGRSGLQRQQRVHDGHVRSDPGLPARAGRPRLQRQQPVHDGHVRSAPGLPARSGRSELQR